MKNDNQQLLLKELLTFTDEEKKKIKDLCAPTDKYIGEFTKLENLKDNGKYIAFANLKRISRLGNSSKNVYSYVIICKDCRSIKLIRKSDFNYKITCQTCNTISNRGSIIGTQIGIYKILSLENKNDNSRKLYYLCECTFCKEQSIVRKENLHKNEACVHCKKCTVEATDNGPLNVFERIYVDGALSRGLSWNLSKTEFRDLIFKNCYYCNAKPRNMRNIERQNRTGKEILVNGIDRLDSKQGYNMNNCVTCCTTCNRMKSDSNLKDFKLQIEKIYNNFNKSSTTIENTSENDGSK